MKESLKGNNQRKILSLFGRQEKEVKKDNSKDKIKEISDSKT